ncbi:unnamed protein product, partial [Mesorhabditis spiculigera]
MAKVWACLVISKTPGWNLFGQFNIECALTGDCHIKTFHATVRIRSSSVGGPSMNSSRGSLRAISSNTG